VAGHDHQTYVREPVRRYWLSARPAKRWRAGVARLSQLQREAVLLTDRIMGPLCRVETSATASHLFGNVSIHHSDPSRKTPYSSAAGIHDRSSYVGRWK
jgi:hypothetical protein